MLKVERLRELLKYNSETGEFTKNSGKPLVPDFSNLLHIYDPETRKVTKMKADLVAWILFYGIAPSGDFKILHKNMQDSDNRMNNLAWLSAIEYKQVQEAYLNLTEDIQLLLHPKDKFSYVVQYRENRVLKKKVIKDSEVAKKFVLKLKLKYSKILTRYCIFDE